RARGAGDFVGVDLRAVDFAGWAFCGFGSGSVGTVVSFAFTGGADTCGLRFIRRSSNAPPPTANRIGHSTMPATPSAPMANAAAGVDLLPLLIPLWMPSAAPLMPPTTPLTAAPPTAPAAAVVAVAARLTVRPTLRTVPPTTLMITPWF